MKPTSKVSNGNSNMHMALKQTFETRGNGIPSLLTGGKICDYPHTCGGSECKESACNAGESESEVAQSCLILFDPMNCSL